MRLWGETFCAKLILEQENCLEIYDLQNIFVRAIITSYHYEMFLLMILKFKTN
jgi:hypothetical protein